MRARGFEHGLRDVVLGGDHLQLHLLAADLVAHGLVDFGVDAPELVEHLASPCCPGASRNRHPHD